MNTLLGSRKIDLKYNPIKQEIEWKTPEKNELFWTKDFETEKEWITNS